MPSTNLVHSVARDHGKLSVPGSKRVAAYATRLMARIPTQCIENEDPKDLSGAHDADHI